MSPRNGSMGARDTPYKGLMPYEEDDTPFFFGRDKWRKIITDNLMASRLTVLYGPSGVGKSSVLRAGVVSHLQELARQNLTEWGTPTLAVVVFNSWRDEPLSGLMQQMAIDIQNLFVGQPVKPVPTSSRLDQVLRAWTEHIAGEEQKSELFIILDQFEEYFLYHLQEDGEGTFAVEFPRAVNAVDLPVNFLISLREDCLAKLDRFKGRLPHLFRNRLRIEHLDKESASEAIRKPIQEYNRRQASDQAPIGVEPALVKAVLDQVETGQVLLGEEGRGGVAFKPETPSVGHIETPYLQLVMTRLWQKEIGSGSHRLQLVTLQQLGGAGQIVKEHLDARMNQLPPQVQDTAARVFAYLVTPSGTKIAHTVNDLAMSVTDEQSEAPIRPERQQVQSLLEELSSGESRILRPVGPPVDNPQAGERYEVFHDVLAPAILEWRKRHLEQQRLEVEKQKLKAENEKRKAKVRHRLGAGVLVAIPLLVVLGWQWRSERDKANVLRLESNGIQALQDFGSGKQLDALRLAMSAVQEGKDGHLLEKARAPRLALQQILAEIREHNQFSPPKSLQNSFGFSADFSDKTQKVAAVKRDSTVLLWNLADSQSNEPVTFKGGEGWGTSVSFSPNGQTLATASRDGTVRLWDLKGQQQAAFKSGETWAAVSFGSDGQTLVTASRDGTVRLWDLGGQRLNELKSREAWVAVSVSPNGQMLATASRDGRVQLWDLERKQQLNKFKAHQSWITSISFSPDGGTLATASLDSTVRLWDLAGHEQDQLPHPKGVGSVRFSADNHLVSVTQDGTVRFWKLLQKPRKLLEVQQDNINMFRGSLSPDGQTLAMASEAGNVYVWDLEGKKLTEFKADESQMTTSVRSDRQILATASRDGTVRLWNLKDQQQVKKPEVEFKTGNDWVTKMNFSPDGETLATASRDGTVRLWNLKGQQQDAFKSGNDWVTNMNFSPDGQKLVTASVDDIVRMWDLKDKRLTKFETNNDGVTSVSFSPDGGTLVAASREGRVYLWTLTSSKLIPEEEFRAHQSWITQVRFSPDRQQLVTASLDGTLSLWNLKGERLAKFQSHRGVVVELGFMQEGKQLATVSSNGDIQLWDVSLLSPRELEDPLARGCKWLALYLASHPSDSLSAPLCMKLGEFYRPQH